MNSSRVRKLENQLLAECEQWYCRHCKESFWNHKNRRVKCPHCGAGLRTEYTEYNAMTKRCHEFRGNTQVLRLVKKAKA